MKFLFLVLLSVSCSSQKPKDTASAKAPATAPQKSPYTVGECACMKIYQPVCGSNGQTYGNSCEAECNKVTWTEGGCKK